MITQPVGRLRASSAVLQGIKQSEALRLETYLDDVGVPTIGWGHTGPEVRMGQKISEQEAEALFRQDIAKFERGIQSKITAPVTQNQYDALVSFAYNVGLGAFAKSTLLKKLNAGDITGAAEEFGRWNKAQGKVLKGLTNRRQKEKEVFLGQRRPDDMSPGSSSSSIADYSPEETVTPPLAMQIGQATSTDPLLAENQRIAADLAKVAQELGADAENLTDEMSFRNKLRKESRGIS